MEFLESNQHQPSSPSSSSSTKSNKLGLVIAGVIGSSAILLSAICAPFVTPALRKVCLPYVPATTKQISNIFQSLQGRKGSLIDLGSGDGRIVFEAAQKGFNAVGVELNFWLVLYSKLKAIRLSSSASFYRQNIWKVPLNNYETVVIFGVESMMRDLEIKCQKEMKTDAVVVACRFPLPSSKPDKVVGEGIDKVWLYKNLPSKQNYS